MNRLVPFVLMTALSGCATTPSPPPAAAPTALVTQAPPPSRPVVSNILDSKNLHDAEALAHSLPLEATLVVFDIDDTILTAPRFFGSDTWYRWQKNLPDDDQNKITCLFTDLLGFDYEAAGLMPTQVDAAEIFNRIPNDKLFLTSRSPDYRGGTERELVGNGVVLPSLILGQSPQLLINSASKRMTYDRGIYMTAGFDKGEALVQLLDGSKKYTAVILVDDGAFNIERMQIALKKEGIDYYGVRYFKIKEDPHPTLLPVPSPGQIAESRAEMTHWLHFLSEQYPERFAVLKCGNFPIPKKRN